jgi:hypothetical protein
MHSPRSRAWRAERSRWHAQHRMAGESRKLWRLDCTLNHPESRANSARCCYHLPVVKSSLVPGWLRWMALGVVLAWVQCGGADDNPATDEPACAEIIQAAYGEIEEVRAMADRACARDNDCTLFDFGIDCTHGFRRINVGGRTRLRAGPLLQAARATRLRALPRREHTELRGRVR